MIQLSRGNIEYRVPDVRFGVETLSGLLLQDRKAAFEVTVNSENNVPMHLFFFSQNPRIRVSQPLSIGRTGKFTVEINTVGLVPNDRILGDIDIVYNGGETKLPYDFTIGVSYGDRVQKCFNSLEEFASFAAKNPKEAAAIFAWKDFREMPFMQNLRLYGLYHSYLSTSSDDNGLFEFLSAAGIKVSREEKTRTEISEPKKQKDPAAALLWKDRERRIRISRLVTRYEVQRRRGINTVSVDFDREFSALTDDYALDTDAHLAYAWYLTAESRMEEARKELLRVQDAVQKDRLSKKDHYCLFMKLASVIEGNDELSEQCRELSHKLFMDGARSGLMFEIEYRLNPEFSESTEKASQLLLQYYTIANHDPMVFLETCSLWERDTSAVTVLTEYELRSALFGLRTGLISEKTLFYVFSHELKNPKLLPLYMLILKLAYRKFGNQEFLQAVCNVYLQQKRIGIRCFSWYKDAVNLNFSMPGLYEYFMASLPKDYSEPLPMNLVLYFGYGRENSSIPLDLLYSNIVTFYRDDEKVWDIYREKIEAYAVKKLRMEEFSKAMLPVFETILDREHLSPENAQGMMSLLELRRIRTSLPLMRRVAVHYPQLQQGTGFAVTDQEALAPLFSEQAVIAFEDRYGVRHYDPDCEISKVFDEPDLYQECASLLPERLLLLLREADPIRPGTLREKDLFLVTTLIKNKNIDAFYRARLYEALVDLAMSPGMQHVNCCEFLMEAEFCSFTPEYRTKLLEVLIDRGYYKEAFARILEYGAERLNDDHLQHCAENMMDQPVFRGDRTMTAICYRLFRDQHGSSAVYEVLASYFEGGTADMLQLIRRLRQKHQPTKGLVEQAFTECLYAGNNRELDALFEWYMSENGQEPLLKSAYLTLRSHMYFMGLRSLTDTAAEALKKAVWDLPKVGMLALLTYFADDNGPMSTEDRELCESLVRAAANENIVLGCFRKLERHIQMPVELEGRVYVEYRDPDALDVAVIGQILPGRHYFHRMLHRIYPGVYVRSFVLYKREWIQYYVSVHKRNGTIAEAEGDVISQETDPKSPGSRYADIARLEQKISRNQLRETADLVRTQLLRDAMIDDIFSEKE
ncbi:MAG: hypothetical protein IKS18_07340 [Lachnospiraceae bacterium]|nr:hypothetical protein [Lachnospiraceae bacterium]